MPYPGESSSLSPMTLNPCDLFGFSDLFEPKETHDFIITDGGDGNMESGQLISYLQRATW